MIWQSDTLPGLVKKYEESRRLAESLRGAVSSFILYNPKICVLTLQQYQGSYHEFMRANHTSTLDRPVSPLVYMG